MNRRLFTLIAIMLIVAISLINCAEGLISCPIIDDVTATSFTAAGYIHPESGVKYPYAICSGYIFIDKATCPQVPGWKELKSNKADDGSLSCEYREA